MIELPTRVIPNPTKRVRDLLLSSSDGMLVMLSRRRARSRLPVSFGQRPL
jgi:hypothetical protein